MPGTIPDARFRLPTTFAATPELSVERTVDRGVVLGRNVATGELDAIYVGKHAEAPHQNVWMDVRGAHVIYVMGKRRSGKSYTLGAIAEGLMSSRWIRQGEFHQGVLILDTMNVFLTMGYSVTSTASESSDAMRELRRWRLASDEPRIRLLVPSGCQMPSGLKHRTITLRASDLGPEEWCGLFEVDPFVDPIGHLITTLHAKVSSEGYQEKGTGRSISGRSDFGLEGLLVCLDRDAEIDGFPKETRGALRRRLLAVQRSPLFSDSGLDVRGILKPGEVSVLLLRDLEPEMRSVMVSLIVKQIMRFRALAEQQERMIPLHLARAARYEGSEPDRAVEETRLAEQCRAGAQDGLSRCWLLVDEAHNYVPSGANVPSRKPLKKYVDEGRNLGLSIVVATQQPSGLDPSLQRNADMLFVHSLSHQNDITAALGMINTGLPEGVVVDGKQKIAGARSFVSLVRSLPLGYVLASTDKANRLIPLKVRPRVTIHGGADY